MHGLCPASSNITRHFSLYHSLMFTGFAAAGILGAEFVLKLLSTIGWNGVFNVMTALALVSVGLSQVI